MVVRYACLKTIGMIPPEETKDDDYGLMEHFNNTVIQENVRYHVDWP